MITEITVIGNYTGLEITYIHDERTTKGLEYKSYNREHSRPVIYIYQLVKNGRNLLCELFDYSLKSITHTDELKDLSEDEPID